MKKYLEKIKAYIAGSLILYALEVMITSVILFFPGYLIDHYLEGRNFIVQLTLIYVGVFTVYLLIAYFSNRIADYRRIKFEKSIKKDFFDSVINKTYGEYYKYDVGEYLSMQANDITEMCQGYLSPLLSVFRSLMMITSFGVALVVFVDLSIAVIIIIFSIIVVFIPKLTAKTVSNRNGKFLSHVGRYTSMAKTLFEAYDILDHQGKRKVEEIHEKELDSVLDDNMKFRQVNSLAMVINGGAVEFMSVIAFITIALLLLKNKITVGMAAVAFTYSTKFMDPIHELNLNIGRINSIKEIKNKLGRIMEENRKNELQEVDVIDNIEVRNVKKSFGDIEITIPELKFSYPKKYLILGENGAGKSVLFRLLMGFYQADCGTILFNGRERVDTSSFMNYVPQQPILFEASYLENVSVFGTYETDHLSLYESLFPQEMVERIKKNFDKRNLSGGEKQVIALLRALCSGKQVLLLDEPFSAMNQEAIDRFMLNMDRIDQTIIVIAHNVDHYKDKFDDVFVIKK